MYTTNDFKALEEVVLDYVERYGLTDKASKYFKVSRERERALSKAQVKPQRPALFASSRNAEQPASGSNVLVLTRGMLAGREDRN